MNTIESQPLNSTLQLLPVAKTFPAWHLAHEISQTATPNAPEVESREAHNSDTSMLVKDTGGYFHGGLND